MKSYDVVTLGELLIDFTSSGTSKQGNPVMEANPGGAPGNVMSMLTRLGKKTGFIGKVGKDIFGNQLIDAIKEVGIDTAGIMVDEEVNTTLAFVQTKPDGDREFSFYRNPGADMMISENDLDENMLKNCRAFHFGTLSMTHEKNRAASYKAIDVAKEAGAIITFDPNLREPLWKSLDDAKEQVMYGLSKCDVLKISDNEIEWLTGNTDFDEGVKWIKERYPRISLILVSAGADGSIAYTDEYKVEVPAFVRNDTIETTGAGDTFCACVINYCLDHDMRFDEAGLKEMLTFANAAASIVTTRKGALRVMPTKEEVEKYIEENK